MMKNKLMKKKKIKENLMKNKLIKKKKQKN